MSDPEQFLSRWSRRKREAATSDPAARAPRKPALRRADGRDGARDEAQPASTDSASRPFDPASLPPIEFDHGRAPTSAHSLHPACRPISCMRRFAALGRAIPAIRDFVGLSENAWDFTAPDACRASARSMRANCGQLGVGECARRGRARARIGCRRRSAERPRNPRIRSTFGQEPGCEQTERGKRRNRPQQIRQVERQVRRIKQQPPATLQLTESRYCGAA